jgi:hypothetical protein
MGEEMPEHTLSSIDRKIYRLRSAHISREVIAQCRVCGQDFTWLPPNFDMRHRFNSTTHEYCGGQIIALGECAVGK